MSFVKMFALLKIRSIAYVQYQWVVTSKVLEHIDLSNYDVLGLNNRGKHVGNTNYSHQHCSQTGILFLLSMILCKNVTILRLEANGQYVNLSFGAAKLVQSNNLTCIAIVRLSDFHLKDLIPSTSRIHLYLGDKSRQSCQVCHPQLEMLFLSKG